MNMKLQWENTRAWIAHFDIPGFKSMIEHENESVPLRVLKSKLDDVIYKLEREIESKDERVDFQFYADTFIIYSKSKKINDYPLLVRASKNFINDCINKRLPIRGHCTIL